MAVPYVRRKVGLPILPLKYCGDKLLSHLIKSAKIQLVQYILIFKYKWKEDTGLDQNNQCYLFHTGYSSIQRKRREKFKKLVANI